MKRNTYANLKKLYIRYKLALILQNMREKNGAEISDVSRHIDIPIELLKRIENGTTYMTYNILKKYCDLFKVDMQSHKFLSKFKEGLQI